MAGLLGLAAAPAAAREVYSWRTEDGGYAFADDEKSVPARYRDQVEVRTTGDLGSYRRYTPQDDGAIDRYASGLAQRLERLRTFNGGGEPPAQPSLSATPAPAPNYITLRTGRRNRGGVDLTVPDDAAGTDEPIVVETVRVRREGGAVVQNAQVTKRGGRIISITLPRSREWNVNDWVDEEDLVRALEPEE
jgi:hypothetical protein